MYTLYTLRENAPSASRIRHGEETGLCKYYHVLARLTVARMFIPVSQSALLRSTSDTRAIARLLKRRKFAMYQRCRWWKICPRRDRLFRDP